MRKTAWLSVICGSNKFTETFTDDPVNWVKWVIVLIVFIAGFFVAFKVEKLLAPVLESRERKKQIALERGNVIEAKLLTSSRRSYRKEGVDEWWGKYEYTVDGKTKIYHATFYHISPPHVLRLYYVNNPKKLFSMEEYHYELGKGLLLFPIRFLPFILGGLTLFLLGAEMGGV